MTYYTIIYTDRFMVGSHMQTLVRDVYVSLPEGVEPSASALADKAGIDACSIVFVFNGFCAHTAWWLSE